MDLDSLDPLSRLDDLLRRLCEEPSRLTESEVHSITPGTQELTANVIRGHLVLLASFDKAFQATVPKARAYLLGGRDLFLAQDRFRPIQFDSVCHLLATVGVLYRFDVPYKFRRVWSGRVLRINGWGRAAVERDRGIKYDVEQLSVELHRVIAPFRREYMSLWQMSSSDLSEMDEIEVLELERDLPIRVLP
jgi:hypothetical protein